MDFWLLRPKNSEDPRFSVDCYWGHVIIARSEDEARKTAPCADEGGFDRMNRNSPWLDKEITSCEVIHQDDFAPGTVVMSDFNAG